MAKALPIIKSEGTLNKYDFGGASTNGIYKKLDGMFRTKNRADMKIICKLYAIFSQIREKYKQVIQNKSEITVSCKDINSVIYNNELKDENEARSAYILGLASEKLVDKIQLAYNEIQRKKDQQKKSEPEKEKPKADVNKKVKKRVSKPKTPNPKKVETEKPKTKKQKTAEKIENIKNSLKNSENGDFKNAVNQLLDKSIYKFIPKELTEKYKKNTNIEWSSQDIEYLETQIKQTINKLINEENGYIVKLGKIYSEWDKLDITDTKNGTDKNCEVIKLSKTLVYFLKNDGLNYSILFQNLNRIKFELLKLLNLEKEYVIVRYTLLFSIRMLKNQIKKLEKYKIFPDLKLEKN